MNLTNFVVFFKSLDKKFNGDSKNLLKTVIFSLQVGFKGDLVPDYFSNCVFSSSNFDRRFSH